MFRGWTIRYQRFNQQIVDKKDWVNFLKIGESEQRSQKQFIAAAHL